MQTYQLTLGSLTRQLPLIRLNATTRAPGTRFTRTVVDYLFRCESDVRDWLDRYSAAHRS
ncbi:hypothetical protein WP50_34540 [Lactiplantibacillus plantarum]|nr:hypothetical protein WP50_34540 [Lactiplantibacillus plantarum]